MDFDYDKRLPAEYDTEKLSAHRETIESVPYQLKDDLMIPVLPLSE
jgi:hypothetical protein